MWTKEQYKDEMSRPDAVIPMAAYEAYGNQAGLQSTAVKSSGSIKEYSPIEEKLRILHDEVGMCHSQMLELEGRLHPVRHEMSDRSDTGEPKPDIPAPSEIERRLNDIYESVRSLNDRIKTLRNELRI